VNPLDQKSYLPFDQHALGSVSSRLAEAIFSALPLLREHAHAAKSGEPDGLSLVLVVPSPTDDALRKLAIWVDETGDPSIGFGPAHAHESQDSKGIAAIVDRAAAILGGQIADHRRYGRPISWAWFLD
jgi:hypothetical protein